MVISTTDLFQILTLPSVLKMLRGSIPVRGIQKDIPRGEERLEKEGNFEEETGEGDPKEHEEREEGQ